MSQHLGLVVAVTFLTILVMNLIFVAIARTRSAISALVTKPDTLLTFQTALSFEELAAAAASFATSNGYRIADADTQRRRIILVTPLSLTTWGWFVAIYASPSQDGGREVEVGIRSRLFVYGFILRRRLNGFFWGIKSAVLERERETRAPIS